MGLAFYIKKIKDSDLSKIKVTAKNVAARTGKSWLYHYADIINCTIKYGSGHIDYIEYKMYEKDAAGRANVLTIGKNNQLVKKYNDMRYAEYFDNKVVFNKKFEKYLHREWIILGEGVVYGNKEGSLVDPADYVIGKGPEEFKAFLEDKDAVIIKPIDLRCGKGIEKIYVKDWDVNALYEYCVKNAPLVEQVAVQCDEMNLLSSSSVNTVRVVTILDNGSPKIVAGSVRMGRSGSVVDNFNAGGIATIYDRKTGVILSSGYDKERIIYDTVPETGVTIKGFQIPQWEAIKALVKEAAYMIPQIGYVGWDVCISKDFGPIFIEGNSYPGPDSTQNVDLNVGTVSAYEEALRDE